MIRPEAQQVYVYGQYVGSNKILKVKGVCKHLEELC